MKSNISFIQGYVSRAHLAILSVLSIISSVLLVLVAYMTKVVIDYIVAETVSTAMMFVGVAVVMLVFYAVILGVTNYLTTKFTMLSTKHLVSDMHTHLLRARYGLTMGRHSVELLKIASNDAEIAVSTYISLFPTIISMVVKLIAGIALMLFVNYKITLIAMGVGLLLCLIMVLLRRPMKVLHKRAQEKIASSNAYMQEGLRNIEVIKALDIAGYVSEGVERKLDEVRLALEKRAKYQNILSSLVYMLLEMTFLFILVYGGILIVKGEMRLADFIVLVSVIEVVKAPFMTATNISSNVYSMLASCERVRTIDSMEMDEYVNDEFTAIGFDNVSFGYDDKAVIENLTFEIAKGEMVAVLGHSGAGKSTFIKLLFGMLTPNDGSVYVVNNGKRQSIRDKVLTMGYAPQNLQLFNDTIRQNLVANRDISDEEILEVLDTVCLREEVEMRGLDFMLSESGEGLSQGQMQRLAIARAILSGSDVLVLDEPFASIDVETSRKIFDAIQGPGRTVIIVSHDEFVRDMDIRKIVLGDKDID